MHLSELKPVKFSSPEMIQSLIFLIIITFVFSSCTKPEVPQKMVVGKANIHYPRHSEGDLTILKDGSYLLIYSRFSGRWGDMDSAQLVEIRSFDKGNTWTSPRIIANQQGLNNLSASLVRLADNRLALFYLYRDPAKPHQRLDIMMMIAGNDEASVWSRPKAIHTDQGYYVVNNARVIRTSKNRLLVPFALTDDINEHYNQQQAGVYYSDDNGETWKRSSVLAGLQEKPMMEPGLIELNDGRILMNLRTQLGLIYFSISNDGGETWATPQMSTITSPEAPGTMARVPHSDKIFMLYNPEPHRPWSGRTPLVACFSSDEGQTWGAPIMVEADTTYCYSYASVTHEGDAALLTYYRWPRNRGYRTFQMTDLVFRRLPLEWFKKNQSNK